MIASFPGTARAQSFEERRAALLPAREILATTLNMEGLRSLQNARDGAIIVGDVEQYKRLTGLFIDIQRRYCDLEHPRLLESLKQAKLPYSGLTAIAAAKAVCHVIDPEYFVTATDYLHSKFPEIVTITLPRSPVTEADVKALQIPVGLPESGGNYWGSASSDESSSSAAAPSASPIWKAPPFL